MRILELRGPELVFFVGALLLARGCHCQGAVPAAGLHVIMAGWRLGKEGRRKTSQGFSWPSWFFLHSHSTSPVRNCTHISMEWKSGFWGTWLTQSLTVSIFEYLNFVLLVIFHLSDIVYNLEYSLKDKCLLNSHYGQNLFLWLITYILELFRR